MTRDLPTNQETQPSQVVVKAWSRRYLLVLITVAALVVVDQLMIQPMLVGLSLYAPKINLAGRQRMLSQKVAKESLALATLTDRAAHEKRRASLLDGVRQWTAAHRELTGEANAAVVESDLGEIQSALHELDAPLNAVVTAAKTIASLDLADAERTRQLHVLLEQEAIFLSGMEQVVIMLEVAAEREVRWLRITGLAIMATILLLLSGVYFAVLRPATDLIRQQFAQLGASELEQRQLSLRLAQARDELEVRVEQRTRELSTANTSLAWEIRERHATETRMRELAAKLAQASRVTALGQLATGLAHEINQPLASIVSFADTAELLLEPPVDDLEQTRSAILQIKQAALRAGAIVRRMRNFVRRGVARPVLVDLELLVRDSCDLCRPQLEQLGIQLLVASTHDEVLIEADPIEIQQVLVNVLQNAVQALAECPRDQRFLQLRIWLEGGEACVGIADSGPGFTGPMIEDTFAPFDSTKADGLGMGLSISRTLLERYHGRLRGENRPEGGARVVIHLPLASPHDRESEVHADSLCR